MYKSDYEIFSKANLLKNIMYGNKPVSSFELPHGYAPNICCLTPVTTASDLAQANMNKSPVARCMSSCDSNNQELSHATY